MSVSTELPPQGKLSRRRRLGFVIAIVFGIAIAQEVVFRSLFRIPEVEGFNRARYQMMAGTHPGFISAIKHGIVYDRLLFESDLDGFRELHTLNLYGFRTPDFAIAPSASGCRILLLGDSLTEGQGAPDTATIGADLQRMLTEDGRNGEVINLGVVAATLDHLTRLARDAVPLLRPTDVVLTLYANDLPAPSLSPDLAGAGPSFPVRTTPWWTPRALELVSRAIRGQPILRRWPRRELRFFPAVPDPTNPWTRRPGPPPGLDSSLYQSMRAGRINPWLREQSEAMPGMLAHDFSTGGLPTEHLRRIAEICHRAKANLLVAYIPFYAVTSAEYAPALRQFGMDAGVAEALSTDPIYRRQNVVLKSVCAGFGLPLADTTDTLMRAETKGIRQFWRYDSHPRPEGYATIAREIYDRWKQSFGTR